jgi:hypothetical protein
MATGAGFTSGGEALQGGRHGNCEYTKLSREDECDFCSSKNVVRRYQCMDFYAESKNAGVRYDGTNLVLHSDTGGGMSELINRRIAVVLVLGILALMSAIFAGWALGSGNHWRIFAAVCFVACTVAMAVALWKLANE